MTYSKIGSTYVPAEGSPSSKIWIVGEAPGDDEVEFGKPFIGRNGNYLFESLLKYGIRREDCFITYVCHYQPWKNKFEYLLDTKELSDGQIELWELLTRYRPNCILALGNQALYALTTKTGITKWRGSILNNFIPGVAGSGVPTKVLASLHPSYVLRDASYSPTFDFDIRRFAEECKFPELKLPEREYVLLDHKSDNLEYWVSELCNADKLAVDIETVRDSVHILCIGFSPRPNLGVCIAYNGNNALIRDVVERILESQAKKIFHFGTFDVQVLRENGHKVENYWWDTMAAQHTMWCELPRSLAYLTSIYTREPYYKHIGGDNIPDDIKGWSDKTNREDLYRYNCTDVCVTIEIQEQQEVEINENKGWIRYFKYKMEQIQLALEISSYGLPIDEERRALFKAGLGERIKKAEWALDSLSAGVTNSNSPKQMIELLYTKLGLPPRKTREGKLTTDEDAIVGLIAYCVNRINEVIKDKTKEEWERKLLTLKAILKLRGMRKLLGTYIDIPISADGMLRSTFKVCSTETSRWACEGYVDGTGTNGQTFPRGEVEVVESTSAT